MAHFDMPLSKLETYQPSLTKEPDFDAFWANTLDQAAQIPLEARLEPEPLALPGIKNYRLTYSSWDDATVAGRYLVPEGDGPFPTIVFYHGYSGGFHSLGYEQMAWALMGYATVAVDVRGQGGHSSDGSRYPGGHAGGWMTLGISDPATYYYRGVYVDCVRALDFVSSRPEADKDRIGLTGGSQGGGLTLAVAALDDRPAAALAQVPFLCHYRRATEITDSKPYSEISDYCRRRSPEEGEQAFRTLSYFDVMNLADRINCPTYVTVGLCDMTCPPSTIFAAYNRIPTKKEIMVADFGQHENFPGVVEATVAWMQQQL